MENYIVRIYRREPENPKIVAGQVEDVSDGSFHPFTSLETLAGIFARDEKLVDVEPGNEGALASLSRIGTY